ncbi:MAG TPA: hypothetical protein VFS67_15465 [Polyangiaceae bacterium]|jgi:hypothetical protein|nr:hypothetical protein [Polyangiaceae bacterium]
MAAPCVLLPAGWALAAGFLACGSDDAVAPTTATCPILSYDCPAELPSYANEVAPLFAAHCNQCHNGQDPRGPWPLNDPIDIGDWALSIKADLEDCLMPPPDSKAPLSDADRQTLHTWLACGAPNN